MGNVNYGGKDSYYMKITLIGSDMNAFNDIFQKSEELKTIKKCWEIEPLKNEDITLQLKDYFDKLLKIKETDLSKDLRECLVLKINNSFDPEINIILDYMNELSETQFLPLVLILTKEESYNKIEIDEEKYTFDHRLIYVRNYTENQEYFEEIIAPVFLRFCSIHNELGDDFYMSGIGANEKYDLIKKGFPFTLNLACVGRFGQGKSTGINVILQEYKAKESSNYLSQTKKITYYMAQNHPIKILDVPGFESLEQVKYAIEKFKFYGESINKMKDHLHIILYFLNMNEKRAFQDLEYPMIEEILKHESTKIIYVITNSSPNIKDKKKKEVYDRINSGIQGITKNKLKEGKIQMFKAHKDNVVFVNFHKYEINDIEIEQFGKKELFNKIYEFFINSKDYKEKKENFDEKKLEERLKSLRIKGQQILFTNKFWGAAVGIIPFVDMAIQHFLIKKNAIKKVGELYGINIDVINENKEKENQMKKTEKNESSFITPDLDIEYLDTSINENELMEETQKEKADNNIVAAGRAGGYIAAERLAATSTGTFWKVAGSSLGLIGVVSGVALGGYFTHKFCEELLDKFEEYFRKNAGKIRNSYEDAAKYFLIE